jgi:regulator of protease activity HflC (stomatin/prohibitin superfamily)
MADVYDLKKNPLFAKGPKLALLIAAIFVVIILLSASFQTIGPGHKGVVFSRFGGIQDLILGEGLQFKIPFVEFIIPIDVRIQKAETDSSASSKDLQMVSSTIAVNYHVAPDEVNTIYQEIGVDYKRRVIDPSVQESVKAATAQFTAEELITRREEVKEVIKANLVKRLKTFNVIVDEFNIIDFSFSKSFNDAIESKQEAEQKALKAKRDLERIKIEAEQKLTRAKAEAEGQDIQSKTITTEILQLRAIEKWDGHFPQVVGGALPFIDIGTLQPQKRKKR